jgi:hypothetical protein
MSRPRHNEPVFSSAEFSRSLKGLAENIFCYRGSAGSDNLEIRCPLRTALKVKFRLENAGFS